MSKITLSTRDGDVVVEAVLVGETLAVHPNHEPRYENPGGYSVTHVPTGLGFGLYLIPTEAEAIEAAECALANADLNHVLQGSTQEDCAARMEEVSIDVRVVTVGIMKRLAEARVERLHDEGKICSPEEVLALIEDGEIEGMDNIDEVCEGIEAASDETKNQILIRLVSSCGEEAYDWAEGYSEPGYTEPENGVLLGDWWHRKEGGDLKESLLVPIIGACGAEVEWHDEWNTCGDCRKAVRCSPDSYSWTRSYVEWSGEISCHECMEDDDHKQSFLGDELEDNPDAAETLGWDLEGLGYTRMDEDFQRGLYGGQSADPHKIAAALRERGISRFVFQIDSVGQFDARFSCWIHEDDMPEDGLDLAYGETDGPDPVVAMKAAMQDATAKMSNLSGEGVKVATCNADGTADVRLVSEEDFIAGKALGGAK
jgi:hypothetical protein